MAPKKKKIATVHYYQDGTFDHDLPSPVTVTILKAPDIDDLVDKAKGRITPVDDSRHTWLFEHGAAKAYQKINVRKCNLQQKAIQKKFMNEEDAWCVWCADQLSTWFITPPGGHATPKLALKDEQEPEDPKQALEDGMVEDKQDEEPKREAKASEHEKSQGANGEVTQVSAAHGPVKKRLKSRRSSSSSSSSFSTSETESSVPAAAWKGAAYEDVANSLAHIAPELSNERDCKLFNNAVKYLGILYKRRRPE